MNQRARWNLDSEEYRCVIPSCRKASGYLCLYGIFELVYILIQPLGKFKVFCILIDALLNEKEDAEIRKLDAETQREQVGALLDAAAVVDTDILLKELSGLGGIKGKGGAVNILFVLRHFCNSCFVRYVDRFYVQIAFVPNPHNLPRLDI